jgi:hypothetical protein
MPRSAERQYKTGSNQDTFPKKFHTAAAAPLFPIGLKTMIKPCVVTEKSSL